MQPTRECLPPPPADFFSSLGRRSPKSGENDTEDVENVDKQNGNGVIIDETTDSNANQSQPNSEITNHQDAYLEVTQINARGNL